jgi:hypothetical protein
LRIESGEHRAVERHEKTVPKFVLEPAKTGVTAKPMNNLFPTRTFSSGEVLARWQEKVQILVILEGTVRVTGQSIDRVEVEMPALYQYDVIGWESIKPGQTLSSSTFTYTATETVTVYVVDKTILPFLSGEQREFLDVCLGQICDTHLLSEQLLVERIVETTRRSEVLVEKNEELLVKQTVLEAENADLTRRLAELEYKVDEYDLRMGAIETRQKASDAENRELKAKLAEQGAKQAELDQTLKNIGELLIGGDTLAEAMVNQGGFKGAMGLRAQNLLHALRARAGDARTIPFDDLNAQVDRLSD